jgi:hypothetical protein
MRFSWMNGIDAVDLLKSLLLFPKGVPQGQRAIAGSAAIGLLTFGN